MSTITLHKYDLQDFKGIPNMNIPIKYYNIIKRGKFYIEISECKNIEDLTDSFITTEKLKEKYSLGNNGKYLLTHEIKSALLEWSEMIKPGSACTSIQPPIIKELLFELDNYDLQFFIPTGYEIMSNRIYHHETEYHRKVELNTRKKEARDAERKRAREIAEAQPYERQNTITQMDKYDLFQGINRTIITKYDINPHCHIYNNLAIPFAKRLINWRELHKEIKQHMPKKQFPQDIIWIKKLWDNPELIYAKEQIND